MEDSPPLKITSSLLREAADLITIAECLAIGDKECTFMCIAVVEAFKMRHELYMNYCMELDLTGLFEDILREHEVDTHGLLEHPIVDTRKMTHAERQALRFDFLNLLAESMEPRWRRRR